jgi:hypothetical protein
VRYLGRWLAVGPGFRLPRRMPEQQRPELLYSTPTILELAYCRSFEGLHAQKLLAKYVRILVTLLLSLLCVSSI